MVATVIVNELLDNQRNPAQYNLVKDVLQITHNAAQSGDVTTLQVLECVALAYAHIADVTELRRAGAHLMRSWAAELEANDDPILEPVAGRA